MGGHALEHKRAEFYLLPPGPENFIIIGHDTKHVFGEHPLWRADAKDSTPDKAFIDSVRKHGYIQPVRGRKLSPTNVKQVEVVVGRERIKTGRILQAEGMNILVPVLLWPFGTPDKDIIGAANAENFQRKHESVVMQAEHIAVQLKAEGYFDGANADECFRAVTVSTGMSAQRQKNLLAFREDTKLVQAVLAQQHGQPGIGGESALAIATLPKAERERQMEIIIKDPSRGTVVEVRERVAYVKAATQAQAQATDVKVASTSASTKPAKKGGKTPAKKAPKHNEPAWPGISKPLQKRIVEAQLKLKPAERYIDEAIIKAFKASAGIAGPNTVPGLTRQMRELGMLGEGGE